MRPNECRWKFIRWCLCGEHVKKEIIFLSLAPLFIGINCVIGAAISGVERAAVRGWPVLAGMSVVGALA